MCVYIMKVEVKLPRGTKRMEIKWLGEKRGGRNENAEGRVAWGNMLKVSRILFRIKTQYHVHEYMPVKTLFLKR